MKNVHLVITDLFLPEHFAAEVCAGLAVPALEKLLARGHSETLSPVSLEDHLCGLFGVPYQGDAPIAAISAGYDGLPAGNWMRADPVHLSLQRDQLRLSGVLPTPEEATILCASLNAHFAEQGMLFFAPHPQRWYVQLDATPRISTTPLSEVMGANVRGALPTGEDASRWHQLFNEIQMLLFAHPVNEAREARGEVPINSVWFWGGGELTGGPQRNYLTVSSDELLVEMFATAADSEFKVWPAQWHAGAGGTELLVWTGLRSVLQHGDMAAWRSALQEFETGYAQPLWQALRSGEIDRLQLDVLGEDRILRVSLTRADTWSFWRRTSKLAAYSLV